MIAEQALDQPDKTMMVAEEYAVGHVENIKSIVTKAFYDGTQYRQNEITMTDQVRAPMMTKQKLPVIARLFPPKGDGYWKIKIINITKDQINEVQNRLFQDDLYGVVASMQSQVESQWMFITLQTTDQNVIKETARIIAGDVLNCGYCQVHRDDPVDFTAQELGLL